MTCYFKKHKFHRVGRSETGKTIERYVECTKCSMVILMINVHPDYRVLYESFPKPLYFQRKVLKRNANSWIKKILLHVRS